jgi:hypothetical protein
MIIDPYNPCLPEFNFTLTDKHQKLINRIHNFKCQFVANGMPVDNSCVQKRVFDAFNYVCQSVDEKKKISVSDIRHIHSLLGLDGQYRMVSPTGETVCVNGYYTPIEADHLESLMDKFILLYADIDQSIEPLQEICTAYFVFGLIHPFVEANGRTGRLICAWLMFQCGYGFLAPHLERRWGDEKEEHAKAFKSQINNYWAWLAHSDYFNGFFSSFYLYFLEEVAIMLSQMEGVTPLGQE